jgi:N4-gp56 family major capsid protein
MANTYTGTATIANQTGQTNLVLAAYDKYVEFALRPEPMFRNFADKHPVDVDKPGSSITLQRYVDLAVAATPLTENVDPDSVALTATGNTVITLNEYGNAVLVTEKLQLESLSQIDPAVANIVAYNMRDTLDGVAVAAWLAAAVTGASGNIVYEKSAALATTGPTNTVTATDVFKSRDVRYVVSKLRGKSAVTWDGGFYIGLIHPDVSYDLRTETGTGGIWRDPHVYSGVTGIWNGEVGAYEGVRFIETPRTIQANDGATAAKVHRSMIFGRQAFAEAVAREPGTVIGPVTDKLMRFRPIGWKGLLGWNAYRNESWYRIETSSTY